MDPEARLYRVSEDRFKCSAVLFDNSLSMEKVGPELAVLEERINYDGGDYITVVKQPIISDDEVGKLRKAKPKTLPNLNDLYPIVLRGWVDMTQFKTEGMTECILRVKLEQYIDEYSPPETSKP